MKQVLDLAERLISINSTNDKSDELKKVLEICKKDLTGFNFKEFGKNNIRSLLFYNSDSLPARFKLILNAHLDVVEGKAEQFKPYQKNGKLFGRGAYDMKTAVACMILLFKEFAKKVNYPLGLQLVTDEEVGGFNGTKYQIDQGIRADFVIAGENTDLKINHRSKGIIWLKVKTKGQSAHGAYPWLGKNAIWKIHKILNSLEKQYPIPSKEMWCTTINLANIESSNKTINKVPDECTALLDIRYIPEEKGKVLDGIKRILGKEAELEMLANEPDHFTEQSNKYIQLLSKTIKDITKKDGELVDKHGASDIRHFNKVGCEGITFGLIGEGHHSDDEWVDLKSVEDYYKILKNYLVNME